MKLPRNLKIFRGQLDAAPFAAVFFLMVIFLVLESKLIFNPGVRISLPEVRQAMPGPMAPALVVAVDRAGQYYYESQWITEEALEARLRTAAQAAKEKGSLNLDILADESAVLEPVYRLASLAGEIGFKEINCVVRQQVPSKKAERPPRR